MLSRFLDQMRAESAPFEPGHVWLAGAGPGSLETVTLGVFAALQGADAVVYDALVNADLLAYARQAEHHYVGKRGGQVSTKQGEINDLLIRLAAANKRVLRLKGGDPFVFGRGGEELMKLTEAGVPFRVLPGVTSAFGAAASAVIPATMRGLNKAVILATGHGAGTGCDVDWTALARTGQPIIIYMGLTNLPLITAALINGGMKRETPTALIMAASTPDERVLEAPLEALAIEAERAGFASPSLVFIGEIVALRRQLLGGA